MAVDGENDPENSQTPTAWPRCNGSPTTVLTKTDALKTCPLKLLRVCETSGARVFNGPTREKPPNFIFLARSVLD